MSWKDSVLNVDASSSTVKDRIPEALEYACVNWASHVVNEKLGDELASDAQMHCTISSMRNCFSGLNV